MPTNRRGRRARRDLAPDRRRHHLTYTSLILLVVGTVTAGIILAVTALPRGSADLTSPPTTEPTPTPTETADVLAGVQLNPLEERRIQELRDFTEWLRQNDATGFVGELGWPKQEPDVEEWNALADKWYSVADQEGLWSTIWAAGSDWSDGYPLTVYAEQGDDGLDAANRQAEVLESHVGGDVRVGVNLAGLEFGTESDFSSSDPGELGTDFFTEREASFAYLASRGVDLVRLPFRWERLQPTVFGDLSDEHLALLRDSLDAALANGIDVILDLHNYGRYEDASGQLQVGTDRLPADALADVWRKISAEFSDHEAVLAYGLMNEPHSFEEPADRSAARLWEDVSQQTLSALRSAGDDTLIMVAGYDWSSLKRWERTHPTGWIDDPADNFKYEAHHYWDADGSGSYARPFVSELAELPEP